ncbi:MAG: spore germination protein GerW family protein [Oscillospiraceae bacterium]
MSETKLESLVQAAMQKIREMIDCETIIGKPVVVDVDTTIIPVSKVSFGFASGGSDLPSKSGKDLFGGGSGAGVTIQPLAFITVHKGEVKLLQMTVTAAKENAVINLIPDVIDKVSALLKKKSDGKNEDDE